MHYLALHISQNLLAFAKARWKDVLYSTRKEKVNNRVYNSPDLETGEPTTLIKQNMPHWKTLHSILSQIEANLHPQSRRSNVD